MLSLAERIALPGEAERVVWAGGDSTFERLGSADWTHKLYGVADVEDVYRPLAKLGKLVDGDEALISVAEMLCLVVLAASCANTW